MMLINDQCYAAAPWCRERVMLDRYLGFSSSFVERGAAGRESSCFLLKIISQHQEVQDINKNAP